MKVNIFFPGRNALRLALQVAQNPENSSQRETEHLVSFMIPKPKYCPLRRPYATHKF